MVTKAPSFPRTKQGLAQAKATQRKLQKQRQARRPEARFRRMKAAETNVSLSAFTSVENQTKRFTISLDNEQGFAAAARIIDGQKQIGISDNQGDYQWFDFNTDTFKNKDSKAQFERQFKSIEIHSRLPQVANAEQITNIHSAHQ
jgi:hypothetical protein